LNYFLLDLAEYYNKTITKSARNPLTSLPPTFLLPTSLPPTFKLLISSPPTTSKKFNYCYASASFKKQANRIAAQNV